MQLYAMAVHEVTHMSDGLTYHNEAFAVALTQNFAKTSGRERQLRAVIRSLAPARRVQQ